MPGILGVAPPRCSGPVFGFIGRFRVWVLAAGRQRRSVLSRTLVLSTLAFVRDHLLIMFIRIVYIFSAPLSALLPAWSRLSTNDEWLF